MLKIGIRQLVCLTLLSLSSSGIVNGTSSNKDEVELALAAIGSGSAEELKIRLFTYQITVFDAEFRARAITALPTAQRDQRITQGNLLRRVETVFQLALQLHGRGGKVELFLFHHDLPTVQFWRSSVLMIPDCLAEALPDGELAGIIAHELGHSYFEDEMAAAQRNQDFHGMRVIELKCDAVAMLSLKLLGYNPVLFLEGLQRIKELDRSKSRSHGIIQSHPELVIRAQFSHRLIKSLG